MDTSVVGRVNVGRVIVGRVNGYLNGEGEWIPQRGG